MGMEKFFYRVKSGDSVLSISKRFNCSMGKLISINRLKKEVSAGDILLIEKEKNLYMVKYTDTIEKIAVRFCTTPEKILENNCLPYIFCGLLIVI